MFQEFVTYTDNLPTTHVPLSKSKPKVTEQIINKICR